MYDSSRAFDGFFERTRYVNVSISILSCLCRLNNIESTDKIPGEKAFQRLEVLWCFFNGQNV